MELDNNFEAITEAAYTAILSLLQPGLDELPHAEIDLKHKAEESRITVRCQEDSVSVQRTLVLVVHFLHRSRKMQIPNIMIPESMRYERMGKRTIKALFDVAEAHGYQLLIVDLVPSFFDRLVKRGARPLDDESVLITATTDLVGDVGSPKLVESQGNEGPVDILAFLTRQRTNQP